MMKKTILLIIMSLLLVYIAIGIGDLISVSIFDDGLRSIETKFFGTTTKSLKNVSLYKTSFITSADITLVWKPYVNLSYGSHNFSVAIKSTFPEAVTWNGSHFFVNSGEDVFAFNISGNYTDVVLRDDSGLEVNLRGLTWNGSHFFTVGDSQKVIVFNATGNYTGIYWDVGSEAVGPEGITSNGSSIFVVDDSTDRVYGYTSSGTYTGFNFSTAGEEVDPKGMYWLDSYFYIVGVTNKEIYQYKSDGAYNNVSFYIGNEVPNPRGLTSNGSHFFISGVETDSLFAYNTTMSYPNISIYLNNNKIYENKSNINESYSTILNMNLTVFNNEITSCALPSNQMCILEFNFTSSKDGTFRYSELNITFKPYIINYDTEKILETSLQDFDITIANLTDATAIDIALFYNGTFFSPTSTSITPSYTIFNYSFNLPKLTTSDNIYNYSFYFNYNHTYPTRNESRTSETYNQSTYKIILTNCSSSASTNKTLHFITRDETNSTNITADSIKSFFDVWLNGTYNEGQYKRNYSIITNNTDYLDVCIYPTWAEYKVDILLQYKETSYDSRDWIKRGYMLNNVTKTNYLYLLLASTSYEVTVVVTDEDDNYYPNVLVEMELYDIDTGEYALVEVEITNSNGEAIFSYDIDEYYRFILYFDNVEIKRTEKAKITSSPLNIQIARGLEGIIPYSAGIDYHFSPLNTILLNNTEYDFNFNLTSSYWGITNCVLYLKNGSSVIIQSSSTFNASNCDITITYDTGNFTSITSEVIYELNNTVDIMVSMQYEVRYTYEGEFSLKNFIDDISNFGKLGFNDFTRMVIALIVIIAITLGVSYKLKITDEETLIVLVWALVLFFSYVGWLVLNFEAIPEVRGLAEGWLKQYIIFILISLASGYYIIKKHTD